MMSFKKGQMIFAEGDTSDAVFVIQIGSVRLSAKSPRGKNATLDILRANDFVGKDALTGQPRRTVSASALTSSQLLRIKKRVLERTLSREIKLSNLLWAYVLGRNLRYQQDLLDQRCSDSEKRLAHVLLLEARLESGRASAALIPKMRQGMLAEIVGTTRSRISYFMNRFRELGFIHYDASGALRFAQ
jgi:CRP-like cAMP-binding protein